MTIELVRPSNHLILCCPLLLLPSIFPSIWFFSSESALHIRRPKYWSFSFSISPSSEYSGLISFRTDWLDLLAVQETQESSPTPQFKSINSSVLSFLYSSTLTSIHDYWKIAEKRRDAKGKGEKERYTHLNAEFQRIARRVKKSFLGDQCKETEENNKMGKTRSLQEN